jgi:hypothetical protein
MTSFYAGLRISPFPARRQKPARNKHRSALSQNSVKCNRPLLCKENRSSSIRSKIRGDCSAHHRLCTTGSFSFIEKSTDILRITSKTSITELKAKKLDFNPLIHDFNNHDF